MAFTSVPSYFSKPSFGTDSTGLSFGGSPLASSAFGSIPSYANNAASVKPLDLAKPTGMDPFSIGAAVLAPVIGGIFGQSAAQKQADATEEAARIAAASTQKAAKIGLVSSLRGKQAGFGYDYLTARYEGGAGGGLNRLNAARDLAQKPTLKLIILPLIRCVL